MTKKMVSILMFKLKQDQTVNDGTWSGCVTTKEFLALIKVHAPISSPSYIKIEQLEIQLKEGRSYPVNWIRLEKTFDPEKTYKKLLECELTHSQQS